MNSFDYIVVGAGAAGCVLANRLSANPSVRVALVEAGPSDTRFPVNFKTTLPIGNIFLLPHARYNWQHAFSGGPSVDNREIACPRGRLFGGCTSVNGTVYMRGHASNYDEWARLGNDGWSYADVLPVFKRHENRKASDAAWHGVGGELDVEKLSEPNVLAQAFVDAAAAAGHARNDDFNGASQDGFGQFDLNQRGGVRLSSSRAFLHPVLARKNLVVLADTLVGRVNLKGSRAVGVSAIRGRDRLELTASREIILAGGTVNSPQLLMLSGVGPASDLRKLGIESRIDLPGVGENLQDHPTISVAMENPSAESYALSWRTAPRVLAAPFRYLLARQGMLASNAAEAGGFFRSLPALDRPDLQMTFMVGMKESARTLPYRHGMVLHVAVLRPRTRGTLTLTSSDPSARPMMRPRFLEDRRDVDALIRGVKEARRLFSTPELSRFAGEELAPGKAASGDADLEADIRARVATTYHPVGACKMGPASDPFAVVDSRLRVHGVEGLRVADASIMPNIIGGNTSAPSMMIGERAADFILGRSESGDMPPARKPAAVRAPTGEFQE